jgi:hypothetical protein
VVENITYKNITLHQTRQAFEMNMEWRMVGPRQPDSNPLPVVRNVKIINVTGDVQTVGSIHGLPGSPIQGITFENCNITADRGFRLDHARNVDLKALTIDVKQGDPLPRPTWNSARPHHRGLQPGARPRLRTSSNSAECEAFDVAGV